MKEKTFEGLNKDGEKVTCQVVATFDLNGRHYLFYTDNVYMYAGYYETKKIKEIKNIEEYNLLLSIYNSFKLNHYKHEFFDYGYLFIDGENIKMIYDKYDQRRYFFKLIDGKYKEIDGEIKNKLNKRFNQEVLILANYPTKNSNEDEKKIENKIRIILAGTSITLGIISGIVLANLNLVPNAHEQKFELDLPVKSESVEDITNKIKNNNNLFIKDKAFFMSLDEIYEDNLNYIDFNIVDDYVENVNIIYEKDSQSKYNQNNLVSAIYNLRENKIVMFTSNEPNENNYGILLHEYLHCLSFGGIALNNNDCVALTEGINEMICREYMITSGEESIINSYSKQQVYARMLCEILGPSKVLEAQFGHNSDILYDALTNLTNADDAHNLVRLINDEMIVETELGINAYDETKNMQFIRLSEEIDELFGKFFYAKYDYPIEEDKLMCSYLDQIRKGNRAEYEYYKEGNTFFTEVNKYYINKKLVNKTPTVDYFYSPGISLKSNIEDFQLQENGQYKYISNTGETFLYNQIPEYVSHNKLTNIIENNDRKKTKQDKVF
ncbi:MAG: hypothetical protein RSD09_01500 [Bacilli bacterium]